MAGDAGARSLDVDVLRQEQRALLWSTAPGPHRLSAGRLVAGSVAALLILSAVAVFAPAARTVAPDCAKGSCRSTSHSLPNVTTLTAASYFGALSGHNLLLIGSSNDRHMFYKIMCAGRGHVHEVSEVIYNNTQFKMETRHDSAPRYCDIHGYNMSVLMMFQCGALSTEPHARWHAHEVDKRCLPYVNGRRVHISFADYIGIWKAIIADRVPQRPLIVVTQSAEWESFMAATFLEHVHRPLRTEQAGLQNWGWQHTGRGILADWDWEEHVESFLEAIRTGFGVQKLYWRTHPNCPLHDDEWCKRHKGGCEFLDHVHEAQAELVRKLVNSSKGIWGAVGLIDWRRHYKATRLGDCDWIHYKKPGYQVYADLLWKAVTKKTPSTNTTSSSSESEGFNEIRFLNEHH
jgi:hypothetical protein